MSDNMRQPDYLTLSELVFNFAFYSGLGSLIGGRVGFWCGVGVWCLLYGLLIWRSCYPRAGEQSDPEPAAAPDPDRGADPDR